MESIWRKHCAPIIRRVLEETRGQDEREIRRALRDAYPYGERRMHPYKIWCSEIKRQRSQPLDKPSEPGGLLALMEE